MFHLHGGERCELAKPPHHEPNYARGLDDAHRAMQSRFRIIAPSQERSGVHAAGRCVGTCPAGPEVRIIPVWM
jgi:hypothetical protein